MRLGISELVIAPLLAIALMGCAATATDLRALAERVDSGVADGASRAELFSDELNGLADELDKRTEATTGAITGAISGLEKGGIVGLIGVGITSFMANQAYRNRQRKLRGEPVGRPVVQPPKAS